MRPALIVLTFAALLSASAATAQQPPALGAAAAGALTVTPVQGNVYVVSGAGPHLTVQVGRYGPVLVDTARAGAGATTTRGGPRAVAAARASAATHHGHGRCHRGQRDVLSSASVREAMVHSNLYNRLLAATTGALPFPQSTITYAEPMVDNSNGEAIVVYQAPAAITDADSSSFFRRVGRD